MQQSQARASLASERGWQIGIVVHNCDRLIHLLSETLCSHPLRNVSRDARSIVSVAENADNRDPQQEAYHCQVVALEETCSD